MITPESFGVPSSAPIADKPEVVQDVQPMAMSEKELPVIEASIQMGGKDRPNPNAPVTWDYGWMRNGGVRIGPSVVDLNAFNTVEKLRNQPKATIRITPSAQERRRKELAFKEVSINGVMFRIPKGVRVEVPQSVADILDKGEDMKAGLDKFKLDSNDDKINALS